MSTVASIVARSLRLIRVLDPDETPEPSAMEGAIQALNAFMRRLEANGVAMGWQDVSNPADPLPVPPEAEQMVAAGLGLLLAPEYGKTPDAIVVAMYKDGLSDLQRDVLTAAPLQLRNDLPWASARGGFWNIYTDSPV